MTHTKQSPEFPARFKKLISPSALGIEAGAVPWWRTVPEAPEGAANRPVFLEAAPVLWPCETGALIHVWGPALCRVDGRPGGREHLGVGRLTGWLHRERIYFDHGAGMVAHFEIGANCLEARADLDVALPIIEASDGDHLLPEYPRCPDCGGRIEGAEASRETDSRRCAGATEPDMPAAGCGSIFVETRDGYVAPVPGTRTVALWVHRNGGLSLSHLTDRAGRVGAGVRIVHVSDVPNDIQPVQRVLLESGKSLAVVRASRADAPRGDPAYRVRWADVVGSVDSRLAFVLSEARAASNPVRWPGVAESTDIQTLDRFARYRAFRAALAAGELDWAEALVRAPAPEGLSEEDRKLWRLRLDVVRSLRP